MDLWRVDVICARASGLRYATKGSFDLPFLFF